MTEQVGVNQIRFFKNLSLAFYSNFTPGEREDGFLLELGLEYRLS